MSARSDISILLIGIAAANKNAVAINAVGPYAAGHINGNRCCICAGIGGSNVDAAVVDVVIIVVVFRQDNYRAARGGNMLILSAVSSLTS